MKRAGAVLVALAALCISAHAQLFPLTGAGGKFKSGGAVAPGYTGPGNIVSGATSWVGLRCYASTNAGGNAIRVRRASDNAEQDVALTASCNLTNLSATFCAATTCFVTKLYDQTGNGNDAAQTTNAKQPQLVYSCIGALPCMSFDGTQWLIATTGTIANPFTSSLVGMRDLAGRGSVNDIWNGDTATGVAAQEGWIGNDQGFIGNGDVVTTVTDGVWHALQAVFIDPGIGDSTFNVDGTQVMSTLSGPANGPGYTIGIFVDTVSAPLIGKVAEVGVWPLAVSSGNQTSLCHNQFTYWGTSTSC